MKLRPHQVGQAGEHLVAAELHRRGAYAVTFSGNMPNIDVLASDVDQTAQVAIQVKTKTTGTWHTSTRRGLQRSADSADNRFWVLVDIGIDPTFAPNYFIFPEWWIENHIHETHEAYLVAHHGARARNPDSTHFGIRSRDVARWRGRWDLLPILIGDTRAAIRSEAGSQYDLGSADDVEKTLFWLSKVARGGSGMGQWSCLLGDFVPRYRDNKVFARRDVAALPREATELLAAVGLNIPPAAKRVLERIANMRVE